jgi:hypothetical protein
MDLSQMIADLEKQAAQYTEAANALRTLQSQGGAAQAAAPAATARNNKIGNKATGRAAVAPQAKAPQAKPAQAKAASSKGKKAGSQKRVVSPETRAKIAAAIKASHDARRAARESS